MRLEFDLEPGGPLVIELEDPVLAPDRQAWACRVSWSWPQMRRVTIYGASSLQSISLALSVVQSELQALAEGRAVTQAGRPVIPL
jgi:hypothetical protein